MRPVMLPVMPPVMLPVMALVVAGLLSATGCTTDTRLDRTRLEADIANQLIPRHPEVVTGVNCPELVDPMPGHVIDCDAVVGTTPISVRVGLGGTADALTSSASTDARLVATDEIAVLLAETFTDEVGIETSVDCGQPVMVVEAGVPVICAATDQSGVTRTFDVVIGEAGELTITIR